MREILLRKNTVIGTKHKAKIETVLEAAVAKARGHHSGQLANYIPELANVAPEITNAAITFCDGKTLSVGDELSHLFTLQSVAKLILLAGLLEEFHEKHVFSWCGTESSGHDFSAIAQLDVGPIPANPCVNAGAINLCSHIPGHDFGERLSWLQHWMNQLFNHPINIDQNVFLSERNTGYRNRALANLLKSNGVLMGDVDQVLDLYFNLCSFEANIQQASYFAMILANGGVNGDGKRVLTKRTVRSVVAIMATCGLYDESGHFLMRTGLPAKSGVSGVIIAAAIGLGGIAVYSPRVNKKGGSVRGHVMLEYISAKLGWHFATPKY